MRLVKHAHACVSLEKDGRVLLIDPGTLTPDAGDLLARADAVLVTHEHFDHVDVDALRTAADARAELVVHGPRAVTAALAGTRADRAGHVVTLEGGERFTVAGFDVQTVGGPHATIHATMPVPENIAYVVDGVVMHPGDSHALPPAPVDVLLVPVSGPWVKTGEAIDHLAAVAPRRAVPIHEAMLSELGRAALPRFLGESGPAGVPLVALEPGESIEL